MPGKPAAKVALAIVAMLIAASIVSVAAAEPKSASSRKIAASVPDYLPGLAEDARACILARARGSHGGPGCIADALERMCARDRADVVSRLAELMHVSDFNIVRGLSRYNLVNGEANASVCDVPGRGQLQFIAFANRPKKTATGFEGEHNAEEKARILDRTDPGAFSRAIEERFAILERTLADPRALAGLPTSPPDTDPSALARPPLKTAGLPAAIGGWTNLTGYQHPVGRINDLLIDTAGTPTTRTMWAGTDGGGIWKTTDSGATWTPANNGAGSLVIGKLLRSAVNAQVLYASTNPEGAHGAGPYGIMKSTDNGASWAQLAATNPNNNADFFRVNHIAIHPSGVGGQDVLLAAVSNKGVAGGIYESTDSGATWTKVSADESGVAVAYHPNDGNKRAYALQNGQFFMTTNGAFPAVATSSIVTGQNRSHIKMAWAKSDANVFVAIARDGTGQTTLRRSADGGTSWNPVPLPGDPFKIAFNLIHYTGGVWIDPTDAKRVAVSEAWAASTADITAVTADVGWKKAAAGWTDFHGITADPGFNGTTNKILYLTDDGGLYRNNDVDALDDQGQSSVISSTMTVTEVYSVSGRAGGNVMMGAQDVSPRVHRAAPGDPGNTWQLVTGSPLGFWIGDGMTTGVSRANPAVLFGSRQYLDLFRSDDGGASGTTICGTPPTSLTEGRCGNNNNAPFNAPFVVDPANADNLYAGARSLWRTTNATAAVPSWTKIQTIADATVEAIALAPSDPNTLIVSMSTLLGGSALYKSTNASSPAPTFVPLAGAGLPPAFSAMSIMVDRTNVNNVWVGLSFAEGLYFSNDGGATFTAVAGIPQTTVFSLAQHPTNASYIYAGTQAGLFASANKGAAWGANNEGPAVTPVRDLKWYSETGQVAVLLVATYGRGVWRTSVDGTVVTPTLNVTKAGSGAGTVTSAQPAGAINCGGDCTETFNAPTPVSLTATADANNVFVGWLGSCIGTNAVCDLAVNANTNVSATFAPGTVVPKVDVDDNNPPRYDALTDGLMILRFLFNLNTVVNGAVGANAQRTTDVAVIQHLTNIKPLLDVDGNGQADALTDGLMMLRYMFGLRGATLIANAVGQNATRTTATQIETYLTSILQ